MFLNAPKLQLLNVLFLVIEDVLPEGVSFQDLHIGSEADDKAAGTFQRVNHRPENPFTIPPLKVLFGQRKFLQQEALGASIEMQGNFLVQRSRHPEHVRPGDIFFYRPSTHKQRIQAQSARISLISIYIYS